MRKKNHMLMAAFLLATTFTSSPVTAGEDFIDHSLDYRSAQPTLPAPSRGLSPYLVRGTRSPVMPVFEEKEVPLAVAPFSPQEKFLERVFSQIKFATSQDALEHIFSFLSVLTYNVSACQSLFENGSRLHTVSIKSFDDQYIFSSHADNLYRLHARDITLPMAMPTLVSVDFDIFNLRAVPNTPLIMVQGSREIQFLDSRSKKLISNVITIPESRAHANRKIALNNDRHVLLTKTRKLLITNNEKGLLEIFSQQALRRPIFSHLQALDNNYAVLIDVFGLTFQVSVFRIL